MSKDDHSASVRKPPMLAMIAIYVGLAIATAVVLYPVLLVIKKAFEPGRAFALSASPWPKAFTTAHMRDLLLRQQTGYPDHHA